MPKSIPGWNPSVPVSSRQRQWVEEMLWKGYPPHQLSTALQAVMLACEFSDYHRSLRERKIEFVPSPKGVASWRKWWVSRELLWNTLIDGLLSEEGCDVRPSVLMRAFRIFAKKWDNLKPEQRQEFLSSVGPEEIQESFSEGREIAFKNLDEALTEACKKEAPALDLDYSEKLEDAIRFLFQVAFPAYMEFGFSHDELLRQATCGNDLQALARVLRLDPTARSLPGISPLFNRLTGSKKSDLLEVIHDEQSAKYSYLKSSHPVASKVAFTGWLIDIFRVTTDTPPLGKPFKVPQIARLFDARARDISGRFCDEDLPESPDTFRKKVARSSERLGWAFWDIFSVIRVPVK